MWYVSDVLYAQVFFFIDSGKEGNKSQMLMFVIILYLSGWKGMSHFYDQL